VASCFALESFGIADPTIEAAALSQRPTGDEVPVTTLTIMASTTSISLSPPFFAAPPLKPAAASDW